MGEESGVSPEVHHYLLRLGDVEKEVVVVAPAHKLFHRQRYEFSLIVMRPVSDVSSKNLAVHWQSDVYSMNNTGESTRP